MEVATVSGVIISWNGGALSKYRDTSSLGGHNWLDYQAVNCCSLRTAYLHLVVANSGYGHGSLSSKVEWITTMPFFLKSVICTFFWGLKWLKLIMISEAIDNDSALVGSKVAIRALLRGDCIRLGIGEAAAHSCRSTFWRSYFVDEKTLHWQTGT